MEKKLKESWCYGQEDFGESIYVENVSSVNFYDIMPYLRSFRIGIEGSMKLNGEYYCML